jgi:RNA polymerase sigma-70 factor (ECF subfamily)
MVPALVMKDPLPAEAIEEAEEVDDRALAEQAARGDLGSYDQLVRRYHGRLYGLVYNMTSSREDTEDLLQEVFLKAFTALPRFKGDSSFYTWVYRIAINRTINFLKKRKKRQALSLDNVDHGIERDEAYLELSSRGSPLRDMGIIELQERLNEALQTLSDKHRTVVVLHDIQGVPHQEIGRMLGVSEGTVRSRLFYARQRLQHELAEFAP